MSWTSFVVVERRQPRGGRCHLSGGGDVVDVEGDGGQAAVGGAVGVAAVDAAASGEGQSVEGLVALGVVRGPAAVGLHRVVQAAEQAVGAEVEDLIGAVG